MRPLASDLLAFCLNLLTNPPPFVQPTDPLNIPAALYDAIPACVLAVDNRLRITIFNRAAEELAGHPREKFLGRDVREVFANTMPEYPSFLVQTINGNRRFVDEEISFPHNGRRSRLLVSTAPLYDKAGTIAGAISAALDITPIREVRHRMHHLETLAALGQLAAGTAHEIRNPLTSIRGFTQLIQARALRRGDATTADYCRLIMQEIDHVNNILSDILSLARPHTRQLSLLNIVKIVHDVIAFMYGEAILSGITLRPELPPEELWVQGHIDKLKEVLINICRNAFQAMGPGGILTLSVSADAVTVKIALSDTGCGMTRDIIEQIFTPFFTTKETGTGLGLAICQQIMHEHGGDIQVESTPGQGSTFTLLLPRCLPPERSEAVTAVPGRIFSNSDTASPG
ncbi:two-component system sensor histidine kinase NtrB [Sporolituus thermophilus]|uniref:histidine kinase n=1 Tax=Sporolituus thermophilus DSM 23256 TaxID=1123285 RepID=A0A1G7MGV1_9FIRM|nr:ATP-binding protein [Sporolituus thermophilus]SDF60947.1 PAS/PAC sensor signal transduction histidine kinase [Sporolituus thermophilus DSM 23256]